MKTPTIKIRRNVPLHASETPRRKWGFSTLEPGDIADIKDRSLWPLASKHANNFAAKQNPPWHITTKWLPKLKLGRIRRLS